MSRLTPFQLNLLSYLRKIERNFDNDQEISSKLCFGKGKSITYAIKILEKNGLIKISRVCGSRMIVVINNE